MKKININTILLLMILVIGLVSCSGEFDTFQEEEILSGEINSFLDKVKPEAQVFEIDPNSTQDIISLDEHIIKINENTFSSNEQNIQLKYAAIERVGDLILNNMTTEIGREILFIESAISLDASVDGKVINADDMVEILKPNKNANEDKYLFQQVAGFWMNISENNNDYLSIIEWETADQETQVGFRTKVETNEKYAIAKPLILGEEDKTPVCINLSDDLNGTNTNVYLQLKFSANLIALLWNAETMQFCDQFGDVLPVGLDAKIITVSHHYDGRILYGSKNIIIENDQVYTLETQEVTQTELLAHLKVL